MSNQLTKDQIDKNTKQLIKASKKGDTEEVKRLISVSDPTMNDSEALKCSAEYGHIECVKLLIPVSDPKAEDSIALAWAAYNGHIDIVELLIPRIGSQS